MTVDWMYWIVGVLTATMLSFGPWVTPSGHDPEIKWKWCARNILFELSFLICKMEIIIVPPLVLPLWLEIIYFTWDFPGGAAAAAAAKSLQSCPTLCNPIDGSPPGPPRPWDSPGKNTGVGCHFLLQRMKVKSESEVPQSCSTLSNPMDCSLPGSSVNGIFQARILEWGAIAFNYNSKRHMYPNVHCSTIYNSQDMEAT